MKKENFTLSFKSSKTPEEIFKQLLNVKLWWFGVYNETIDGKSHQLNDEFTFKAGEGMHYSKQKLVELISNKRIVWLITESKLTFLKNQTEWTNTKICFDLTKEGNKTVVNFTHEGLTPEIECYTNCSTGWTAYLKNLREKLN